MRGKLLFSAASAAVAAALSFTTSAAAQSADPAGDASTEARLSMGEAVSGSLDPAGDRDWFRLSVQPGNRYSITLDSAATMGEPGAFDPMLVVYDANGAEVARNDDANESLNSALAYLPSVAGDVFVEARGFSDDAAGNYVLRAESAVLPPDNAGNDALTRARLNAGQPLNGQIEVENDEDWFRLNARTGQMYRITLNSAEGAESPLGDPVLRVVGAGGEELAANDDSNESLNSQLEFVPRANGEVFVVAGGFGGSTGAYTLNAEASRLPRDDAGNGVDTRARLNIGGEASGALDYVGDSDWYRVRLTEGQAYRFRLNAAESAFDPLIRLYNSSGEELASDDDGGDGLNSYLEYAAAASGDYYLEARGYSDDATGAYTIAAAAGDIPNDASTDASLSAEGDYREGTLAPAGDSDWYRIDLTEGQTIRVALNSSELTAGLSDPYVVIYGADSVQAAQDDDSGDGLNSLLEFTAPAAGSYYIEARGFVQESAEGGYVLTVTAGEIGDSIETADYLVAGPEGRTSRIGVPGDVDWFALEMVEGRPYRIFVDYSDGALDPMIRLLDDQGNEIATDDDGGPGLNARVDYASATGGPYFIAVSGFGDTFGEYMLRVVDNDVFGNAATDEYLDATGDSRLSRIEMSGDIDAYGVSLEQGVRYEITVSGEGDTPLADPYLTIVNSSGESVATDDDGGDGLDSRLIFTPETADLFYVQASGLGGSTGTYRVSVTPQTPRQ